jgi:hypothetical protein
MEDGMTAAYQHLAVADVRPGMVLSDEIVDARGQVLLPRGAVLTVATIALLPRHGLDSLAVLRADLDAAAAPAPDLGAIQQRLDHLFRKHDIDDQNDWGTGLLRRYIEDFRLGREIES